jgi:hypothetical protein
MADISVKLGFISLGVFMILIGVVWLRRSFSLDEDDADDEEDDDHSGLVHIGFGTYQTPDMCFLAAIVSFLVGSILILIGIFA